MSDEPLVPAIVFCEDDPAIQKLVRVALRSVTRQLLIADNGRDGLALVERARPAVVFTDVAMPEMSGIELCRAIKGTPALAAIPVVLVTASAQRSEVEAGMRCGAAEVLVKPFAVDYLRALARRYGAPRSVPIAG